ncbi:MAG: hypothetical protein JKX70_03555 [Phycisphaerales bacterium]|nr:hypothetical protein [Phycisphaerales bacterium]
MKHGLLMIGACVGPLVLLFLLPLFGISGNITLLVFIVLMFGGHLLMMKGHTHHHHESHGELNEKGVQDDQHNT